MNDTERYKQAALLIADGSWDKAYDWLDHILRSDSKMDKTAAPIINRFAVDCAMDEIQTMRISR